MGHQVLTLGSLFTGIGGFDEGFRRAGIECAWQVEIDDACNRVLARRFPGIQRFRDVRDVQRSTLATVDVIAGGFPCQDVSLAGTRKGLAGERSSLWFEFLRIVRMLHPRWVIVENPPGLLSSNRYRDFATVLRGLVECGYGVSWRILDAQYFGMAQQRRRVFIVGSLGSGRSAQVLFESECSSWNPPPRRQARQKAPAHLAIGSGITCNAIGLRQDDDVNMEKGVPFVVHNAQQDPNWDIDRSVTLDTHAPPIVVFNWQSGGDVRLGCSEYVVPTLQASQVPAVVVNMAQITSPENGATVEFGRPCPTLDTKGQVYVFHAGSIAIRRLTPQECERLQGFPDGWTEGESDTARYRMLGNAVNVKQVLWIAQRIVKMEREGQ